MPYTHQLKLHHTFKKTHKPIFLFHFQIIIAIMTMMLGIFWKLMAADVNGPWLYLEPSTPPC